MADYTTINDAGSFYSTKLYTGTGSSLAVTGAGFQPDFTWIKNRDTVDFHVLTDSVRGATKYLQSQTDAAEVTNAESLKSFDSDGFTVGTQAEVNTNTEDYASWNWKAGTTTGIATNGSTTITPSAYSFNQTAGMSIIKYTGTGTSSQLLAHGLGAVPTMFITKAESVASTDWIVYNVGTDITAPQNYYQVLNSTAARVAESNCWDDTAPDTVNMPLGSFGVVNTSGRVYIAYCFANVQGFSNMGWYEGNGNARGACVYTGFRPALVIVKSIDSTSDWHLADNKRLGYNAKNSQLFPSTTAAENSTQAMDLSSNGFRLRVTGDPNTAETWMYAAFAESPFVNSSGVPVNAR